MSNVETISEHLAGYLHKTLCLSVRPRTDDDLLQAGAIDSLTIMELVRHVEAVWGVRLEPHEISPRNFQTLRALGELVVSKRAA